MSHYDPWTSHRRDALIEDATFLMDTGLSMEQAAVRLGVEPGTLRKEFERRRRRDAERGRDG